MPLIAQNPKPRVILGTMTFGPPGTEEDGSRVTDLETYKKALDLLQSRGYSELDTARVYNAGKQEGWTKQAGWQERGFTLATKVKYPSEPGDNTADKVVESVQTSLKELGTDCVDVSNAQLSRTPDVDQTAHTCFRFFTFTVRTVLSLLRKPWKPWTSSTRPASLCASVSATLQRLRWPRSS